MNRRGMSPELIVALILGLVFLGFIGVPLVKKIQIGTEKGYEKSLCKQSVLLNSKVRLPVAKAETADLSCPTRYITFNKTEFFIESQSSEIKQKVKCGDLFSKSDKECYLTEANKMISSLLFDCWDQFAAGRVQVLDVWTEKPQCVLCARVAFSKEVQADFGLGSTDLLMSPYSNTDPKKDFTLDTYLRTHTPPLHTLSYYEFLLDPTDAMKPPTYDYSLDKPYAIVFSAINEKQSQVLADDVWEFINGGGLGLTAESGGEETTYVNILEFKPYDQVAERCATLQ
ncbi:MAG: hypothetical protein Q7S65_02000 [Nanoarchaeota archaeon]|nr:hypothetical protein [Nanoarchaeota archaeon]